MRIEEISGNDREQALKLVLSVRITRSRVYRRSKTLLAIGRP